MSETKEERNCEQCVAQVLSSAVTPVTLAELQRRVAELQSVGECSAGDIDSAIKRIFQAVPTTSDRYGWLSSLLAETTFRHPLISREAKKGFLMLDEMEHAIFFPDFFQNSRPQKRRVTIELMDGPTIEAKAYIEQQTWALRLGVPFRDWVDRLGGQQHDAIIIHVVDAMEGRYLLRLQPREARDDDEIRERNLVCARMAESIVTAHQQDVKPVMPAHELAASLVACDIYRSPVPPDDMHYVLHHFSVLQLDEEGYRLEDTSVSSKPKVDSQDRSQDESTAEAAMSLFGWQVGHTPSDSVWDLMDIMDEASGGEEPFPGDDEACHAYQNYLDQHEMVGNLTPALPHDEFHMLEAELEYLIALEIEFGWLLPEQESRKNELANRLYLDPDALIGDDDIGPIDPDTPPYWEN